MTLDGDFVKVLHQCASQALSSEVWSDSHCTDMGVPVLDLVVVFKPFNFANQVALDVAHCVFTNNAVLAIRVQIPSIKVGVKSLSQQIHVYVVEFEQVKHIH